MNVTVDGSNEDFVHSVILCAAHPKLAATASAVPSARVAGNHNREALGFCENNPQCMSSSSIPPNFPTLNDNGEAKHA